MQSTDTLRGRRAPTRALLLASSLAILLGAAVVSLAGAPPRALSAEDGQAIFQQKCAACHTIGKGDTVGPDLKGVTASRDRDWLTRWISAPDKMLAQKDPIATELLGKYKAPMPNLGLSEADVAAVLDYLQAQSGGAPAPAQPGQAPASAGDPVIGGALFQGDRPFQAGGPACMACHSVAGMGALGGGALGPDLTGTFTKYGDNGLTSVLATLPFPTMKPVFDNKPLTPEEQANLKTFLQSASVSQRPAEAIGQLAGLAVGGLVVLVALTQLVWRRRLVSVRGALVRSGKR